MLDKLSKFSTNTIPLFILFLISGCGTESIESTDAQLLRPVRTLQVEQANRKPIQEFTAVVDASQKVDLSFKISGKLVNIFAKPGDQVSQGQLIAQLDDTDIKIQLLEAQSSYEKAKADFNRAKDLIKSNAVSHSDFDKLKAQYNSALAQYEANKNKLQYTQLVASFNGIIAKRYVENYQEINALAPIVALHDLNNINFKVDIPESVLIHFKPGSVVPEVSASFASIPDAQFPLTFKEISTQADEVTKTYQVVFSMPSPKTHTILPGMSAIVEVTKPNIENAAASFYLPAHCVLKDANGNYIFVVKQVASGKGEISRRNIVIGDITPLGIEIFDGITNGEHVVTAGMSKVSDGMLVKFNPAEKAL